MGEIGLIMFQYGFIDFDDTLFKTYVFKEDIFGCFARCGVTREDYAKTYKQAVFGPVEGYFDYTFEKHADILRELGYQILDNTINELNDLLKNDYNDDQTVKFLLDCRKFTDKLILLTAGEPKLQQKKIDASGLAKYFDQIIIIDGGKSQKITDVVGSAKKIYYINDNIKENIEIKNNLPNILIVALKHRKLWEGDNYEKMNLPYFDTLEEIKNYVEQSV